jgi:CheY-like chemotaxis protein
MPGGGTLAVALDHATLERARATPTSGRVPEVSCVRLSVSDSGVGIAPEIQSRIFEPFFSTKPPGSGTGLGLAMVYGIVHQASGETRVRSELGRGARFDLYLPRVLRATPERAATDSPLSAAGGNERVLVVEDDEDVRALTVMILREGGYEVHEAQSAEHALALPPDLLDRIDLVVSDVIMPGLPGPELVQALTAQRPRLRSVLVSGFPADHRVGDRWFLPKPFGPSQLLRVVRDRLDTDDK